MIYISCDAFVQGLSEAYYHKALPEALQRAYEQHLAEGCDNCEAAVDHYGLMYNHCLTQVGEISDEEIASAYECEQMHLS